MRSAQDPTLVILKVAKSLTDSAFIEHVEFFKELENIAPEALEEWGEERIKAHLLKMVSEGTYLKYEPYSHRGRETAFYMTKAGEEYLVEHEKTPIRKLWEQVKEANFYFKSIGVIIILFVVIGLIYTANTQWTIGNKKIEVGLPGGILKFSGDIIIEEDGNLTESTATPTPESTTRKKNPMRNIRLFISEADARNWIEREEKTLLQDTKEGERIKLYRVVLVSGRFPKKVEPMMEGFIVAVGK